MTPTKSGRKKFRPDLSGYYEILTIALVEKLNENSILKMSKTDAVKMAIERAAQNILPDLEIKPKRKRYIRLNF